MRFSNLFFAFLFLLVLRSLTMPARSETLQRLACPATWPQTGSGAKLAKFMITPELDAHGPLDQNAESEEWSVSTGDEASCAYASGARLLITIPGLPRQCHVPMKLDEDPGASKQAYCIWLETGDASKDAVHIREMEQADRSSAKGFLDLDETL